MKLRHPVTLLALVAAVAVAAAAWWFQRESAPPPGATASGPAAAGAGPGVASGGPPGGAPRPGGPGGAGGPGGPVAVEVAKAQAQPIADDVQAVGTLRARQAVMLRPEVPGRVQQIGFTEGRPVRRGQVLVQLDDALQRAQLQQAKAQASIATTNLQRSREL
ncbi:MAG: biotin/lipoyl-binding protein, partial [Ideonella sp.]|nr:biotin/lipoyl-binding protein [Ideonella sp.]